MTTPVEDLTPSAIPDALDASDERYSAYNIKYKDLISKVLGPNKSDKKSINLVEALGIAIPPNRKTITFVRHKDNLIIPWDEKFHYFKFKESPTPVFDKDGSVILYRFVHYGFPIFREGFVVIGEDIIFVPIQDIKRGVIRPSRRLEIGKKQLKYPDFVNGTFTKEIKTKPIETIKNETSTFSNTNRDLTDIQPGYSNGNEESKDRSRTPEDKLRLSDVDFSGSLEKEISTEHDQRLARSIRLEEGKDLDVAMQKQSLAIFRAQIEKEGESWEDWETEGSV
jgi:hypothetical protein